MSRKTLPERQGQSSPSARRTNSEPGTKWLTFGTLVASTAITGAFPAAISASQRQGAQPAQADTSTDRERAQASAPATFRFDIHAGRIADLLATFEQVTGVHVTLALDSIGSLQSPGVSGVFTAEDALQAMLAGTSVWVRMTSATSAVFDLATLSESVEVRARAGATVSSPRYTQPLRDIPQTIVVIPGAVLRDQGVTTLRDALRNTPGITLTAGEGGTAPGDNFLIRGFSARNDVYIDGARDPGVVSRDTFNTESVEVAKGPSSATVGRGSTGGSINLVTKSAGLRNANEVRLSAGNAEQRRGTFDVNRRLNETTGLRMNGMWQDSGVPGRNDVVNRSWGFAPSVGVGLGRPTTVTVGYQHLQQDNVPDYGLPATLPAAAADTGITVDDLDFSNFYGLLSRDREGVTSDVVTATVEHRFASGRRIRNLTRYGRNHLDRVVTPPRAATEANAAGDPGYDASLAQIRRTDTKYQYRDDRTLTNHTDVNATFDTGSISHNGVVGVEASYDRQPSYAAADLYSNGRPPVADLFSPDPSDRYTPAITRTGATSEAGATSLAAYAFDTLEFGDRLQADLGIRWDWIDVNYSAVSTEGVESRFSRADRATTGRVGLLYKPTTRGTVYAAFSTSFDPSYDGRWGLTLADSGANAAGLPPERSRNIEIGSKWDLTPVLFATVAVFDTDKTNAKTTDATTGATVLAGDQRVTGVEFGLSGNLTPLWSIFAGLSLMDGTIEESLVAAEVDRQLSYVPRQSFNLWSTYRLPKDISVGAGAQYTGGYYFNNTNAFSSANAEAIQLLTRYWLLTAMAGYRVNRHLELQINVNNLANARYVERGYTGHFIPGPSRSLLLTPVITF